MALDHLLIHQATITRVTRAAGSGGAWPETPTVLASNVACRRQPASSSEQQIAFNAGAIVTHTVYFKPGQDVRRDDEVAIAGTTYFVRTVVEPSVPIYRKALVEERVEGA